MFKSLSIGLVIMLVSVVVITGCSKKDAVEESVAPTATVAPTETAAAAEPVLNSETFVGGVDKSIDIPKTDITIDGTVDDWAAVKAYDVTIDADGKALKHTGSISLAWDGDATLYAKGTIKAGDKLLAAQPVDGAEWYGDDVFEIFLNSVQPKDASANQALTAHYGINSIQAFTSGDVHQGVVAKSLPYADGTWTFEASYPIDEANLTALKATGSLLGKAAVELNSTQEFYQVGRTGGFWDTDNFIIFKFLP
jgi:major membrane immunogen (membrane-anchored lipoprotein)